MNSRTSVPTVVQLTLIAYFEVSVFYRIRSGRELLVRSGTQ